MTIEVPGRGTCALCSAPSCGSGLVFFHERKGTRQWLEVGLCETCGNRMEKHLKRAVPKRLFESSSAEVGVPPGTISQLADVLGTGWE